MRIKTLSVGLGVEVVKADLQRAMADLAAVGESLRPAKIGIGAPEIDIGKTSDQIATVVDAVAARVGMALGSVGAGLGRSLQILAPIADRTAGAIITGFRRIDAELTFPKSQAALRGLAKIATNISIVGAIRDVVPAAKMAGSAIASGLVMFGAHVKDTLRIMWDRGPVMQYWRDVERAGLEAYARIEAAAEAATKPRNAQGQFVKPGASPTATIGADDLARVLAFEQLKKKAETANYALTATKEIFEELKGAAASAIAALPMPIKVAVVGIGVIVKTALTPFTLMIAAISRTKAAIEAIRNKFAIFGDVAGKTFSALFGQAGMISVPFRAAISPVNAFGKAVKGASGMVGGLTSIVKGFGVQVLAAFGLFGVVYKSVQFFREGVKAASDLNETVNASKQVFGNAFGDVDATVSRISSRFGILRKDQLDAAAGFGSIAKGAGATEGQAANLAIVFTNLAADFASFKNLSFEDAASKLRSGLAGESEPLRRYGALLTEDAVKAKGFAMGLGTITGAGKGAKRELSDLEKIQARAALIMDKLKDSQGDLARTSGDAANQFRKAGGGIAEFQTRIGELLLPAVKAGTVAFNEFLAITLDVFGGMQPYFTSWMESAVSAFQTVGYAVRNAGAFWEIAKLKVYEFAINAGRWIMTLPENLANFASWLGSNWLNLLTDGLNAALAVFKNFGANLKALGTALGEWLANPTGGFNVDWTPLLDGFQATAAKLPDLIRPELYSVQSEVDKIMKGIQEKEAKRVKGITMPAQQAAASADVTQQAAETAKKGTPEVKLASAVEASSKEAYSAIVKTQASNDPARDAAKTAKEGVGVQKQQLGVLNKIANQLGNQEGAPVFALGPA